MANGVKHLRSPYPWLYVPHGSLIAKCKRADGNHRSTRLLNDYLKIVTRVRACLQDPIELDVFFARGAWSYLAIIHSGYSCSDCKALKNSVVVGRRVAAPATIPGASANDYKPVLSLESAGYEKGDHPPFHFG
jgi:hypothetical protein